MSTISSQTLMKDYDTWFIQKLQSQNADAFTILYNDYVDTFYRYIKSHYTISEWDTQDILGDIFVKIWQALPRVTSDASLSGFIRTIAKNHIKDFFKRSSDLPFANFNTENSDGEEQSREDMLQDPEDILHTFHTQYNYETIQQALQTLDESYRDPIILKFIEDASYEEIAQTLNISQDSVRQRISRWLKKLADLTAHIK